MGDCIQHSIVGIGLNINQQNFQSAQATSLVNITHHQFSLPFIFDSLLESIEARYLQLKSLEFSTLHVDYLKLLYRINELHRYRDKEAEFEGIITGIDEQGRLKIKSDTARVFDMKEVQFIY